MKLEGWWRTSAAEDDHSKSSRGGATQVLFASSRVAVDEGRREVENDESL